MLFPLKVDHIVARPGQCFSGPMGAENEPGFGPLQPFIPNNHHGGKDSGVFDLPLIQLNHILKL